MKDIPTVKELFDTTNSLVGKMLDECHYPHEALSKIKEYIKDAVPLLDDSYREISSGVYVSHEAKIWPRVTIIGPAIIGRGAELRPGAFIRENVIIGDGALVGNSSEVKNSIIFNGAKLPHYNYLGDSIIGFCAHMGAGSIASNLRLDKGSVGINGINTKLRKVGAFIGDFAEVGCNTVLCPGTMIGKGAMIYPLSVVRGIVKEKEIYKGD